MIIPFYFEQTDPNEKYDYKAGKAFPPRKFWVILAHFDLKFENNEWWGTETRHEGFHRPDVDLIEAEYCFETYTEAFAFIASWWHNFHMKSQMTSHNPL